MMKHVLRDGKGILAEGILAKGTFISYSNIMVLGLPPLVLPVLIRGTSSSDMIDKFSLQTLHIK